MYVMSTQLLCDECSVAGCQVRALFKVLDIDDNWKLDRDEIVRVMHVKHCHCNRLID